MVLMLEGNAGAATTLGWFIEQLKERWYFLIIFGAWGLHVGRLMLRAGREAIACKAWINGQPVSDSKIAGELQLFVSEAERWRLQGIAVPMTDYSDRVDSIIEGMADHLHSAVNLFLIIGLAGTFFGMAEFARQASALEKTTDPSIILNALRAALGHSFPIGFLGLVLTAVGHPIASLVEGRLRESAMSAVNQALRLRNAAIRKTDSDAIVQALASLATQLQPLLQIPEAIKKANQESLEPLRGLFAESQTAWQSTVTTLGGEMKRMADAVDRLEQPIQRLRVKMDDIGGLVASTQETISRILADAAKVAGIIEALQKHTDETAQLLRAAAEELRAAPEVVKKDLLTVHQDAVAAIRSYFEGLGTTYADSVRQLADASMGQITSTVQTAGTKFLEEMRELGSAGSGEITQAAQSASAGLTAATNNLQRVADTVDQQLKDAISSGAGILGGHLETFNAAFRQHFPKAVADLQAALTEASQRMEAARVVLEGMASASQQASAHTEEWKKVGTALRETSGALQEDNRQLQRSTDAIKASAEAHDKVAEAITRSLTALKGAVDKSSGPAQRNGQRNGQLWKWWPPRWPRRWSRKET